MKWRLLVAAAVLWFMWKGAATDIQWPTPGGSDVIAKPDAAFLKYVQGVEVAGILPVDRVYLSQFYDALSWVMVRDGLRDRPVVVDTDKFATFHAGSLQLAIDRNKVGKYPGLGKAIDDAFKAAAGDEVVVIDEDKRAMLVAVCNALAWRFAIHGE